ncbi:hypothetical protein Sango_1259200 [Sesamum angolense]|uniref:Reverse transcriptase n=1 Tax=Sesamum angolense TaxID=2727404 RepID=A0AAE1WQK9_9LAMI|nr:hypothetical protein Sango_1259200 [Sesamum angolense]
MKIGFWNVMGFNRSLKHNGVAHLIKNYRLCLLGILETKLTKSTIARIIDRSFSGWCQTNNFDTIAGECILIIWNLAVIDFVPEDISPQKNSLDLHRPGMSSKALPIAAFHLDLMMPPQRDATLLDHQDFIAIVENGWNLNVDGTTQFSICRKLKALKGHLKAFNNLHFSYISIRAKEADLALQDVAIRDSVGELKKTVVFLTEAERHFYYQKAKVHFLKMGDQNTKFFHDMVKRNAVKSSILAITKSNGSTITSAAEIGQEFVTYFTSLLGTEVQTLLVDNDVFNWGPKLSFELALELCKAVTPLEVKQEIFHISDNKAPGQDGYLACFFKRAWHVVGDQVCTAVLDFFRSGRLLRQFNHNIIALVPKSDHCPMVADYRPISCCNVIHKAITKIIADRLAPALEHLTDRCQATFVGGWSITKTISSLHRK